VIAEVAEFLGLPDVQEGWLDAAAALVRETKPSRALALPPGEAKLLHEACAPGNALLGRA